MKNFEKVIITAILASTLLVSTNSMYAMQQATDTQAFRMALWAGEFEFAQELVASGAVDINTANKNGETPLIEATISGNENSVHFLVSQPGINLELIRKFPRA